MSEEKLLSDHLEPAKEFIESKNNKKVIVSEKK